MAVSLVGPGSTTGNTALASSRSVPAPNNSGANPLAVDDVVVIRLSRWESINPALTATGWIQRPQAVNGSGKLNTVLKRLTSSDLAGPYALSWTGSMWTTGQARAYRGVSTTADLSSNTDCPMHQVTNSGTSWPAATLNGVGAGVLDWHGFTESNGNPHTQPTSFTKLTDNDSDVGAYRIVTAGNYTTSGGSAVANSPNIVSMLFLPEAAGGGSTPAGPALETDTAQTVGRTRVSAIGTATETDTAQQAGRTRQSPVTPATETDVAQPITSSGSTPAGPALETDTAQTVSRTRTSTIGTAAETDTAQPVSRTRVSAIGTATETDVAGVILGDDLRDLDVDGRLEPDRWRVAVEPDRWATMIEPDRWATEVEP